MDEATFIILTSQGEKATKKLYKDVKDLKRHALSSGFIDACLREGRIVDEMDYIYEPEGTTTSKRKSDVSKPLSTQRSSFSATQKPDSTKNGSDSAALSTQQRGRSRSPSPPTRIELMRDGKRHAYTDEDREYVRRYAAHHFRYHPDATIFSLQGAIARRVSHLSVMFMPIHVVFRLTNHSRFAGYITFPIILAATYIRSQRRDRTHT